MSTSSHFLCIDNHSIVYSACEQIRAKWEDLATYLLVARPSVDSIRADGKDCADCLRKLLDEWLRRSSEQPPPSWRGLCNALARLDRPLSERISAQHQCGCSLCTGYQSCLLPEWTHHDLSLMSYGVLPVYRTVKEFTQLRANDQTIYTEPFYTAQGGFKMTLRVYPNGHSTFKGTHLSVRTFLMRGENDETLTFPICGTFRIQLLNWRENSGHVERIWQFDDAISENRRQRVTTGEIATYGWGLSEFLSHDELQNSSDKKYINNDQLCFKIQFEPAHGQQTTGRNGEAPIGLVSPLYNEIYQKLKNPVDVAEYLYSEGAFSLHQLEKMQDSPGNEKEVLLTSLESAVSLNQYNLRVFGKALMKEEATHSLGKSLLANCIKEEFPSQSKIKEILVEMKYKKEFHSLRTALGQLCTSTVTLLSQQKVDVADLKNQLEFAFPELGTDLKKCSSLIEVVKNVIRPRVSLVQIDYLETVFDMFKLAKRALQEYNQKVDELYKTVKVTYGQLLMEEFDSNTSELESIKFVLDWEENEHWLKDVRDLFKKIVRSYSSRVKVIVISEGNSIVVECCVPTHLLPVITRMIQDSKVILNREKVISVTAGGRTIFNRIVTVEQTAEFEVIPKKENYDHDVDKSSDDSVAPSPGVEPETKMNQNTLVKEKVVEEISADLEELKEKGKKLEETIMMKDNMIKQMSAELDELKNRKGYQCSLLPEWTHPDLSLVSYGAAPVYRTVNEYAQLRTNDQTFDTEPFYTAQGGYKMTLRVYPNGYLWYRRTHLSARTFLMRGENDKTLTFPICGTFRVQLLNWRGNIGHVERIWQFDDAIPESRRQRVTTGDIATDGWGQIEFLSHDELENSTDKKYIHNDKLCFKIQFEPAHQTTGYQYTLLPEWTHRDLSLVSYGAVPVYRTIKKFTQLKAEGKEIDAEPFYTAQGGYKMTLRVYPNGHKFCRGTHLSVRTFLMRGENDETLIFPICGIFRVQLLNWRENSGHVERIWQFDDAIPKSRRQRVTTGEIATDGWGQIEFLSCDDLKNSSDKLKYIHNDKLCFKIQFEPAQQTTGPPVPSWCDLMYTNSFTSPCIRTLARYSEYKKTNSKWYSLPFYSSAKGYKLQLCVYANGDGTDKGSHLSLYVYLLKGEHDDQLQWPFNATCNITVQLLNWSRDNGHEEKTISYHRAELKHRTRVVGKDRAPGGTGYKQFISHSVLESVCSDTRYINEDSVCFRIVIEN